MRLILFGIFDEIRVARQALTPVTRRDTANNPRIVAIKPPTTEMPSTMSRIAMTTWPPNGTSIPRSWIHGEAAKRSTTAVMAVV